MAYVQPNSTIQFFKGINLDNRYLHTIFFANEGAQNQWFSGKVDVNLEFTNMMYRRYTSNSVKVDKEASVFHGVTYMRFKNRTNGKWFYAFVLSADYVNENTTLVTYEIDVMQTWFIQNGSVRPCMVLREHVSDDTFGINLEEEPIGSDVYDCDLLNQYGNDYFGENYVVINSTGEPDDLLEDGLFCGTKHTVLPASTAYQVDFVKGYLETLLGSWDAGENIQDIIDIYTIPKWLAEQGEAISPEPLPNGITRPSTYDNYTPRNNKLFMYPYSYLLCTTHNGSGETYRWEYFDSASIEFRMAGSKLGGGQIICYPREYNGQLDNMDCKVCMDDFPKNAFAYDAYQAWLASGGKTRFENDWQIQTARGASAILKDYARVVDTSTYSPVSSEKGISMDHVNLGMSMSSGLIKNVASAIDTGASIAEAQNKILYQFKDAKYAPNIPVGKSEPNVMCGMHALDFYFYHCHVRDDEVKRIDDFFTCYGYSVMRVKSPNLTGRQYWNFVMTENAVIAGDMPSSSKEAIGRIFDGGITFWHNGDNVGNYGVSTSSDGGINNPIVTP